MNPREVVKRAREIGFDEWWADDFRDSSPPTIEEMEAYIGGFDHRTRWISKLRLGLKPFKVLRLAKEGYLWICEKCDKRLVFPNAPMGGGMICDECAEAGEKE